MTMIRDDINAWMYEDEEYRGYTLDGLIYDFDITSFILSDT